MTPQYDFDDPVFRMNLKYKRWAREHMQLATLQSDVIHWNIAQTVSPLRIPVVYHVHYHFKSIVGIDESENPVYGKHHILELSLPEQYPLEGCKIAMLTDVWHPNIKSEGRFKGRVCGNTDSFGLTYDLYQLVLRVGEILQYKNYHAIHTPPYPEDSKVAQWVIGFAEPNGIVDKENDLAVDDTPLVRAPLGDIEKQSPSSAKSASLKINAAPPMQPEPEQATAPKEPRPEAYLDNPFSLVDTPLVNTLTASEPEKEIEPEPKDSPDNPKIKIGPMRPNAESKPKITINPKDDPKD